MSSDSTVELFIEPVHMHCQTACVRFWLGNAILFELFFSGEPVYLSEVWYRHFLLTSKSVSNSLLQFLKEIRFSTSPNTSARHFPLQRVAHGVEHTTGLYSCASFTCF